MSDFYALQNFQQADASCSAVISFNPAHAIFEGHFPGQPVVPGVCSLRMLRELISKALGKPVALQSTQQVKFLRLLLPQDRPEAAVSWTLVDDRMIKASATLKIDDAAVLKMSGVYELR